MYTYFMHETEQIISQAKTLGKLEDQQLRREQLCAINMVFALGYLGAVGVNGLTGQNVLPIDSATQILWPVIAAGAGYSIYNLLKLFKLDSEIKIIKSDLMLSNSLVYEKPKRQTYVLGDDGEIVEVNDHDLLQSTSNFNSF